MPTIGELVIDIKASTASIQTEMGKLESQMTKSSANIVSSLGKIVDLLVIQLGTRAVRSIVDFVDRTIEAGDKIGRLSQATGLSVAGFSGMSYAAKMADVDVEQFATGVERMSFKLLQAQQGNARLNAEFKNFGIDPEKIRTPEEALTRLAEKFASMPPGIDKTALAIEFFGRGGAAMIPFLNLGAKGIATFTEEAQKLGIQLDQNTVAKFEAAHESLKRLDGMFQGFSYTITAQLAPALSSYVNQLVDAKTKTGDLNLLAQQAATGIKLLASAFLAVYGVLELVANMIDIIVVGMKTVLFPASFEENWAQFKAMVRITVDDVKKDFEGVKGLWKDFETSMPKITVTGGPGGDGGNLVKQKDAVGEIIKKLDDEAAAYKKTATEIALLKAIEAGASEAQLNHILQQIARLDNLAAIYNEMASRQKAGVAPYGPLSPADMNQWLGITQQMVPAMGQLDTAAEEARDTMFGFYKDSLSWEEKWYVETGKIVDLWVQFPELGDLAAKAIEHQNAAWDEHTKQINKATNETRLLVTVQRDISQGLADAIFQADSFGDAMQRLLLRIAEYIFQVKVLDPLLDKLFKKQPSGGGGGGGTGILGMLGGFFGGLFGLQGGGTFSAGRPFIAGEAGPELIYPGISGTVIPNHALGGQTVYNIDARGADPTVEFRIRRALRETEQRSVARSVSTTREMGLRNVT